MRIAINRDKKTLSDLEKLDNKIRTIASVKNPFYKVYKFSKFSVEFMKKYIGAEEN